MLCVLQPSRNTLLLILLFFSFQLPLYAENSYWNRFIGMILVGGGSGVTYHAGIKNGGAQKLFVVAQSWASALRSVGALRSMELARDHYKQAPPFFISVKNLATQYTHELMLIGGVTACVSGVWLFFKKSNQKVPKQDTPEAKSQGAPAGSFGEQILAEHKKWLNKKRETDPDFGKNIWK